MLNGILLLHSLLMAAVKLHFMVSGCQLWTNTALQKNTEHNCKYEGQFIRKPS